MTLPKGVNAPDDKEKEPSKGNALLSSPPRPSPFDPKARNRDSSHDEHVALGNLSVDEPTNLPPLIFENLEAHMAFLEQCSIAKASSSTVEKFKQYLNDTLRPFYRSHFGLLKTRNLELRELENEKLASSEKINWALNFLQLYKAYAVETSIGSWHVVREAEKVLAGHCKLEFATPSDHTKGNQYVLDVKRLAWIITVQSKPGCIFKPSIDKGFLELINCETDERISFVDNPVLSPLLLNKLTHCIQQTNKDHFNFMDPNYTFQIPLNSVAHVNLGRQDPTIHINDETGQVSVNFHFQAFHYSLHGEDEGVVTVNPNIPFLDFWYDLEVFPSGTPAKRSGRNWELTAQYQDNTPGHIFEAALNKHFDTQLKALYRRSTESPPPDFVRRVQVDSSGNIRNLNGSGAGGSTARIASRLELLPLLLPKEMAPQHPQQLLYRAPDTGELCATQKGKAWFARVFPPPPVPQANSVARASRSLFHGSLDHGAAEQGFVRSPAPRVSSVASASPSLFDGGLDDWAAEHGFEPLSLR